MRTLTMADIADHILHVIGAAFGLFWIGVYLWILWLDLGAWLA